MTDKEAFDIINDGWVEMVFNGQYRPTSDEPFVWVVDAAMKHLDPNYKWDKGCGDCCVNMLKDAYRKKLSLLKFYTFPKE